MRDRKANARKSSSTLGFLVAALTLASTSGCYKATFVEDPSQVKREPTHEEWSDHFVFGLVGDKEYDTRQWCPEGTAVTRTGGNVGTSALTVVTLGIYAPRKVYVTCEPQEVASSQISSQNEVSQ